MKDDHQLLLYIAGKVARLDAITTAIHSMLYVQNRPKDATEVRTYNYAVHTLYNDNIAAEKRHLENQFPDDILALKEYIELGERELMDESAERLRRILADLLSPPDIDDDTNATEKGP